MLLTCTLKVIIKLLVELAGYPGQFEILYVTLAEFALTTVPSLSTVS